MMRVMRSSIGAVKNKDLFIYRKLGYGDSEVKNVFGFARNDTFGYK
jgi:hypothetical protein